MSYWGRHHSCHVFIKNLHTMISRITDTCIGTSVLIFNILTEYFSDRLMTGHVLWVCICICVQIMHSYVCIIQTHNGHECAHQSMSRLIVNRDYEMRSCNAIIDRLLTNSKIPLFITDKWVRFYWQLGLGVGISAEPVSERSTTTGTIRSWIRNELVQCFLGIMIALRYGNIMISF